MKKERKTIQHWMLINTGLVIYDFLATYIAYILALLLRFDFQFKNIPDNYFYCAVHSLVFVAIFTIVCVWGAVKLNGV